jgi:hypothetical protein
MGEAPPEQSTVEVDNTQNNNLSEHGPLEVRRAVGTGMEKFTKVVNDNLIAARYGIFAGVTLLTVYGLSQTPLFFRYRTIADVPTPFFTARRRLHGRIIGVDTVERGDIRILVRHLSPMGRILPKSWFDFLVKFSPHATRIGSVIATGRPEENSRDLLKIRIGTSSVFILLQAAAILCHVFRIWILKALSIFVCSGHSGYQWTSSPSCTASNRGTYEATCQRTSAGLLRTFGQTGHVFSNNC